MLYFFFYLKYKKNADTQNTDTIYNIDTNIEITNCRKYPASSKCSSINTTDHVIE